MINVEKIKKGFPIFKIYPNLIYLDSAATSLKPLPVIEKISQYYQKYSSNIHRGIYKISEKATQEYEETREVVAQFINAYHPSEIIFTKNTTESLNIIAFGLGERFVKKGDEIITSVMEHNSNFLPWLVVSQKRKARLRILDIDSYGHLDLSILEKMISKKTKIVALTFISNVLGTINPIKKISEIVKKKNPKTILVIDAAQAAAYKIIDVKDLAVDFLAFSAHKILGPTGVGILWGKKEFLEKIKPLAFGGGMVEDVNLNNFKTKDIPLKFEAGTPNIAGVIGLKEAIKYITKIKQKNIENHIQKLTAFSMNLLKKEFGGKIKIFGPEEKEKRGGIIAFTFKNYHPHDVSQILDQYNICLRAGHHCCMILHKKKLKLPATLRISFNIYNQKKDIEKLIFALKKIEKILG